MEFTVSAEDDLLRVRAWGRETRELPPIGICQSILDEAKRHGLTRILIELTHKVALSGVAQFQIVDRLPSLGLTPLHRIALVHHTPGLREASDMIDMAAGNRGLNVRNFADIESALAWLA
ncbi:MAG: hypothetical protein ACRET8_03580 [Burkholderiales bacterium]